MIRVFVVISDLDKDDRELVAKFLSFAAYELYGSKLIEVWFSYNYTIRKIQTKEQMFIPNRQDILLTVDQIKQYLFSISILIPASIAFRDSFGIDEELYEHLSVKDLPF